MRLFGESPLPHLKRWRGRAQFLLALPASCTMIKFAKLAHWCAVVIRCGVFRVALSTGRCARVWTHVSLVAQFTTE